MANKSDAEVALELYRSIEQNKVQQKRLKSSTFWNLFDIKARRKKGVERIAQIITEQGLKVSVRSGVPLGDEDLDDWLVITVNISKPKPLPHINSSISAEGAKLKALSIKQPYAGLIIAGIKNIENRSWSTKYSGQLAIVSTKSPDAAQWWAPMREKCKRLGFEFPDELCKVNGAILGIVDFNYLIWQADDNTVETDHPTIELVGIDEWWNREMIGFIFERPQALSRPIPISGKLGLYNLADDVVENIEKQLQMFPSA